MNIPGLTRRTYEQTRDPNISTENQPEDSARRLGNTLDRSQADIEGAQTSKD